MTDLAGPPVLSTPAENVLEDPNPPAVVPEDQRPVRTEDELRDIYEIERTAREIRAGGWKRIALQFPDSMLPDAPWVFEALDDALAKDREDETAGKERLYILADTSYSACCVDEIAAEHVDADVVVHYGRSCLSPTARLPVIYVFTKYPLDHDAVVQDFKATFPDKDAKTILMADVTYQNHVPAIFDRLRSEGYSNLLSTAVVHDPSGTIPNRKLVSPDETVPADLTPYSGFHISVPPTSLLLALHSRLASLHIHSTPSSPFDDAVPNTGALLRRRFARVLSLATAGTIGILVNTLSVANYLESIGHIRKSIEKAGKKSYTIVVGKLNPAKLANFAEVEGWVVVGCWESGLVEDEKSFYRPVVTPFELGVALMSEEERVWSGEWWGGIEGLKIDEEPKKVEKEAGVAEVMIDEVEGGVEGEESAPPEFDLRTGKLVSNSRPMRLAAPRSFAGTETGEASGSASAALIKRETGGEIATVKGVVSPGAEFLRSQRTWQGLGTDFVDNETSTTVEQGRSGVARGYVVGEDTDRR